MKKSEVTLMLEARKKVQDAIRILRRLEGPAVSERRFAEASTVAHFANQLEEWLSCDQNEAGFEPYIMAKYRLIKAKANAFAKVLK